MENPNNDLVEILKKFEIVNKKVIALARRLSEIRSEIETTKQNIKTLSGNS